MSVEEVKSILSFLSTRMTKEEKKDLFSSLQISSVEDIEKSPRFDSIIDGLRAEKRKRTKVLDIKFSLPEKQKNPAKGSSGIRAYGTHVDKCIGGDE